VAIHLKDTKYFYRRNGGKRRVQQFERRIIGFCFSAVLVAAGAELVISYWPQMLLAIGVLLIFSLFIAENLRKR
jgi:hypothetical protein